MLLIMMQRNDLEDSESKGLGTDRKKRVQVGAFAMGFPLRLVAVIYSCCDVMPSSLCILMA